MISTIELFVIIYLIIGSFIAFNFAYAERKKNNVSFGIIMLFGVFVILLWPFYWPFFTTNGR